jgi:hypothetical protein
MKNTRKLSTLGLVLLISLISANIVLAAPDPAPVFINENSNFPKPFFLPDPLAGYDNIDSALVEILNPGNKLHMCFLLPNGWVNTVISFWHPTDQTWVELETETEIINGVKYRCADADVNGTFAFQGQKVFGLLDPERYVPTFDPPEGGTGGGAPPSNPESEGEHQIQFDPPT